MGWTTEAASLMDFESICNGFQREAFYNLEIDALHASREEEFRKLI